MLLGLIFVLGSAMLIIGLAVVTLVVGGIDD